MLELITLAIALAAMTMLIIHLQWHTKDGLSNDVKIKKDTPLGAFVLAFESHMTAKNPKDADNAFLFAAKLYDELTIEERRQLSFEVRGYMVVYSTMGVGNDNDQVVFTPDFELDEE